VYLVLLKQQQPPPITVLILRVVIVAAALVHTNEVIKEYEEGKPSCDALSALTSIKFGQ
jgi:hypothetical protein